MTWSQWIIGPQLLGVIFLIAGYIQKRYPPRQINALYGYRSDASMQNQQTWDEAKQYSARLMIRYAWILLAGGLILTLSLSFIPINEQALVFIRVTILITAAITTAVLIRVYTEKHLTTTFDNKPL
ncbi:SdpI family protein [Mucilaginibacter sp.]|uniref:SdpI family protein n=1 Tax=Mucilaginibacter sp. TaxID=1882438 RepID=UPI0035BBA2F3